MYMVYLTFGIFLIFGLGLFAMAGYSFQTMGGFFSGMSIAGALTIASLTFANRTQKQEKVK